MDFMTQVVATEAFLASMRRHWVMIHGPVECPIKQLGEYPQQQRMALLQSIGHAVQAAQPDNVQRQQAKQG